MATMKKAAPKKNSSPKQTKSAPSKRVEEKDIKKTSPTSATEKQKKELLIVAQKIRIIVKSFDYTVIDEATRAIVETAERGGSLVSGPVLLPTKTKKYTVNRSFFVHKDARDQYEIRTHKRLIDINEPTPQTVEALQNLSLPAGVDVEIKMLQS